MSFSEIFELITSDQTFNKGNKKSYWVEIIGKCIPHKTLKAFWNIPLNDAFLFEIMKVPFEPGVPFEPPITVA